MANTQPSFHILICLIKIWEMKGKDPMEVPKDAMLISECESIEIEESYKKLIGTASVKFPRGTVIRKTIDAYNAEEAAKDKTLQAGMSSTGVVEELRNSTSVADPKSFHVGQRIRIYLGYTEDPAIADLAKSSNIGKSIFNDDDSRAKYEQAFQYVEKSMNIMFDGYITKISVDTPVELHCENLAYSLKQVTCPKVTIASKATIFDFLQDGGKANVIVDGQKRSLLYGTGLELHPGCKQYDLGKVKLVPDLTVADVLTEWAKYGLHAYVTEYNGKAVLCVGRNYFSNAKDDSIVNSVSQPSTVPEILFDYHVASNGLSLTSTEKKFLAVEAEGLGADDKFMHLTLIRNPQYKIDDPDSGEPWRVVNESKLSKKAMKLGARPLSKAAGDKVSMDLYTKVPYHSRKIPITKDELLEEAIQYYENYNMNGIEGTLTLFGDLHIHTGMKVHLNDNRYPGKNGYYLVEEVHTTFGNGGYRQTIKLPYCISRDKQESNE